MKSKVTGLLSAGIFLLANYGYSQAEDHFIYPDRGEVSIPSIGSSDRIVVRSTHQSSYCCRLDPGSNGLYLLNVLNEDSEIVDVFDDTSSSIPAVPSSRTCYLTDSEAEANTGTLWRLRYLSLSTLGGPVPAKVDCEETLLAGGFNSYSSDFLFLELLSRQPEYLYTTRARIYVYDSENSIIAKKDVELSGRLDVDLTQLVDGNRIGRVSVAHTGPRGTIDAYVAEYRLDTSNSRSGITLVGRSALQAKSSR